MTKDSNNQQHTTPLSHGREIGGEAFSYGRGVGGEAETSLIEEVFQRRALLADLDRLIIADVRRQARRAWLRRWTRAVVFSFGVPLVLLAFAACAYIYIKQHGASAFALSVMVWPTLALIFTTQRALETFSPEDV